MKILITGGTGMLGTTLKEFFPNATFLQGRKDIDMSVPSAREKLEKLPYYDIVIHCAAFTNINYCDQEPEKAYYLHGKVVSELQNRCKKLIYISTNPTNSKKVYYTSKQLGEKNTLVRKSDLVVRVNIYGNKGLTEWGLRTLRKKEIVNGYTNVVFNPVSVNQLSDYLSKNLEQHTGIVNIGTKTQITKYDFLKLVALFNNEDTSLVEPTLHNGILDLTIPLKDQFQEYTLTDGLFDLFKSNKK